MSFHPLLHINSFDAEFYIISKDTDFDKAIEDFARLKIKVKRVLEIAKRDEPSEKTKSNVPAAAPAAKPKASSSAKTKKENQIRSAFGQHFKKNEYKEHREDIIQILLSSKTKQEINNKLMKFYDGKTVSEIYKKLQPLIKDMPGK